MPIRKSRGIEKLKMKFDAVMEEGSDIIAAAAFSQAFHPRSTEILVSIGRKEEKERERERVVDNYFLFRVSVSVISSLFCSRFGLSIAAKWFCSRIL